MQFHRANQLRGILINLTTKYSSKIYLICKKWAWFNTAIVYKNRKCMHQIITRNMAKVFIHLKKDTCNSGNDSHLLTLSTRTFLISWRDWSSFHFCSLVFATWPNRVIDLLGLNKLKTCLIKPKLLGSTLACLIFFYKDALE